MSSNSNGLCRCANCGREGDSGGEVRDFWSRVLPGDTMPAGECEACGCLVYQIEELPEPRPLKVHLNLHGGEHALDHLLTLHLDLTRLRQLVALAAASDIDSIAIRPAFEVISYDSIKAPPADGYVGGEAAIELSGCPSDDHDRSAEPTVRLDGLVLRIAGDGFCYAVGSGKHCDRSYDTESFYIPEVGAHTEADGALPAAEAA